MKRTGKVAFFAAAGLVLVHAVLAVLLFDPKPFTGGENASYVILSESIESGQGYRDVYLPDAPRHVLYPPVYPAVLAFTRLLGGDLFAFKILSAVVSVAAVVLALVLGRSRLGWSGALAVAAPIALSPVLIYYSHWVLPESLFLLLALVVFVAGERLPDSRSWLAVALIAAVLAYLTRPGGLPLLIALLLALGWRRRWRAVAVGGAALFGAVAGWRLWVGAAARDGALTYSNRFLLTDPRLPEAGWVGPGELVARAVNNLRVYSVDVLPESLAGGSPGGGLGLLALLAGLVLIALALIGWVRDIRKMRLIECFTVLYAGFILLWPQAWVGPRAFLPLIPVLVLHAVSGLSWLIDRFPARRRVWALPLLGAVLALLALPGHVRSAATNQRCLDFYRLGDRLACYPMEWRAFVQTALWVRDNTAADAIVISEKPRLYYLFSGRRGREYPVTREDETMLTFLDEVGADYVVGGGPGPATARYLMPVVLSVPARFELHYRVAGRTAPAFVLGYHRSAPADAGQGSGKGGGM